MLSMRASAYSVVQNQPIGDTLRTLMRDAKCDTINLVLIVYFDDLSIVISLISIEI